MGACAGGNGGLAPEFARRVELELVHAELRALLELAPSREVFLEQHRRASSAAGRDLPYRDTLREILRRDRSG